MICSSLSALQGPAMTRGCAETGSHSENGVMLRVEVIRQRYGFQLLRNANFHRFEMTLSAETPMPIMSTMGITWSSQDRL